MDDDWIKSPAARRIFIHWTDTRPAWVWPQDGESLRWRNRAAAFFGARLKKSGLRTTAEPVPIKGQIARLIRLGSSGRSSLARLQFLAGGRPASITATVTPLEDVDGRPILLAVGVDPIDPDVLVQPIVIDPTIERALLPATAAYLVLNADGAVIDGSPGAAERFGAPPADAEAFERDGRVIDFTRYGASPQGDQLVVIPQAGPLFAPERIDDIRDEEGLGALERDDTATSEEPLLPMAIPEAPASPPPDEIAEHETEESESLPLSSLFDRLADSESLYAGLPKANLGREPATDEEDAPAGDLPDAPPAAPPSEPDVIAAVIEFEDDLDAEKPVTYRVTGRGFTPLVADEPADTTETEADDDAQEFAPGESMDGESRRNFSEIGRILTGVVTPPTSEPPREVEIDPSIEPMPPAPPPAPEGALVSLGAETFILNRLPLGILVFRDQQVLFANRALTDLVGHTTIDGLRAAGLASIFPGDDPAAGPVTQLVRRDGTRMPVTARLQSVTWQGRPALMLSAASAEHRASAEAAVRSFAETLATLRENGYFTLTRAGIIASITERASALLGPQASGGQAFGDLLSADAAKAFRGLLEQPARFAETERPSLLVEGPDGCRILVFAEGTAGIVQGYFGIVEGQARAASGEDTPAASEDPAMLSRISRGVRRPLNTIIGFADLIRSAAFGTIENHRYLEYARDIRTAGQEIAVLVDELDDYARLNAGTFPVRPADLDLAALLDSCIVRVRGQANAAHVLVRSAISEELPHIRADRASLGQAILNLLASAIDQTPANGSVILSAQRDEAGGVVVNVRDSGAANVDPGERFVVFRDGVGKDGEALAPVRSSVGLALTRSLIAVNSCMLTVSPAGAVGTIFSLTVPAELIGPAAA